MRRMRGAGNIFFLLFLVGILLAPASVDSFGEKDETKLNLLLLTIDTLRADKLSCYGSQRPLTPNIDQLRERSMLFSRAFANTTTTLPSHTNIFLGTTPNHHGVHENLHFIVREEHLTLAEHLKNNGYTTAAFVGAYPLDARFGLAQGFDLYDDNYSRVHGINLSSLERNAQAVVDAALEWLKNQRSPWFLWIHCWDPHTPYDPPEPFKTQYRDQPYDGEVVYVDFVLGKLFDYLKEKNLFASMLVIFTGDHGESLGEHGEETHGYLAYNSTLWIPLLISLPGVAPGRCDEYVSHVDIFPTVCDALGLKKPPFLHGVSLLPALKGKGKGLPQRTIYFESLYPYYSHGWAPLKGFIFREEKFIDSPIPELYDLRKDFHELNNLLAPAADQKKLAQLSSALKQVIETQTPRERLDASRQVDRETREKLASLGYVSSARLTPKKSFSARDDVKVLLSYVNRIGEAWKLHKQGKSQMAIELLQDILKERDDIDLAYKQLASLYQEIGRPKEAMAILEQGLGVLPSSYEIFMDYIKALLAAQEYDRVISAAEYMSLRQAEHDPEIWSNLGTAYAKKGDYEKAIQAFEMGLSLDDRHPELYNNLANACYSYGLQSRNPRVFSRCFDYYKKAIELDPTYAAPYYGLGHAYREEGNLEAAAYCWEKALEADPSFSRAHFDLAMAHFNLGNKAKALELLTEYKKRYYSLLAPADREKLDALIAQCRK